MDRSVLKPETRARNPKLEARTPSEFATTRIPNSSTTRVISVDGQASEEINAEMATCFYDTDAMFSAIEVSSSARQKANL